MKFSVIGNIVFHQGKPCICLIVITFHKSLMTQIVCHLLGLCKSILIISGSKIVLPRFIKTSPQTSIITPAIMTSRDLQSAILIIGDLLKNFNGAGVFLFLHVCNALFI